MKTKILASLLIVATLATTAFADGELVKTRIGDLSFTHSFETGYPTDAAAKKLLNEMDFQRACQAYIWSTPFVSFAQWHYANHVQLGAKNGQIVYHESYKDRLGGLTFNATTPYVFPLLDVTKEPWIIVMPGPDGQVRGSAHDMWQIGIVKMTKPGKYLFVGPGQKAPKDAEKSGFIVVESSSNNILPGIRLMSEDPAQRLKMLKKIEVYPYSERKNPKPRGFIRPEGKTWMAAAPRGLEYWERLADYINREPIAERDRFFLAMLAPLGIEKGKKFNPTPAQKRILVEASLVGEAMAKANAYGNPRLVGGHYMDGSEWTFPATSPSNQRRENYDALDGRAAWFYEAVTNDYAMHGHESGKGQVYMGTYKDSDGEHLDGAQNYTLHLPANVPAEVFWSLTAYEVDTRTLIDTKYEKGDLSSRMDLLKNKDGSIDVYMGPTKPEGEKAKNWIATGAGRAWFLYFRLYSPKKAFMDKTWVIPNVEKAEAKSTDTTHASSVSKTDGVIVTRENFTKAESIHNANNYIKLGGDNKWTPFRKISPTGDKAPTVRMNFDTLYSVAVLDNSNGKITVTIPEGDVLRTVLALDDEAYSLYYFQEAGEHEIVSKSPFIILIARLGVKNYRNPADIEYAHKLQDGLKVSGQGTKPFNPTKYDAASFEKMRKELKKEFITEGKGVVVQGQFKGDVDENKRILSVAAAYGGMHDRINMYFNSPMMDPKKCYTTTFEDPKVKDFFSFTMYDKEGYLMDGITAQNSYNMKPNADGTYTAHFNCGKDTINNLDSGGLEYNYMVRAYGATDMVKSGKWNPIKDTKVVEK